MSKPVNKIEVRDTIDYWRQQFNNLVDNMNQLGLEYVTPQTFAPNSVVQNAMTIGNLDSTEFFLAAQNQEKLVVVPPGNYLLSQNIDGSEKFMNFGAVSFKSQYTCSFAYSLGAFYPFFNRPLLLNYQPSQATHAVNKGTLDWTINAVLHEVRIAPENGDWFKGYARINSAGETDIGRTLRFHYIDTESGHRHFLDSIGWAFTLRSGDSTINIAEFWNDGTIRATKIDNRIYDAPASYSDSVLVTKKYLDTRTIAAGNNISAWVNQNFATKNENNNMDSSTRSWVNQTFATKHENEALDSGVRAWVNQNFATKHENEALDSGVRAWVDQNFATKAENNNMDWAVRTWVDQNFATKAENNNMDSGVRTWVDQNFATKAENNNMDSGVRAWADGKFYTIAQAWDYAVSVGNTYATKSELNGLLLNWDRMIIISGGAIMSNGTVSIPYPAGYTMKNSVCYELVSIGRIYFSGDVNGDDTLECYVDRRNRAITDRVDIICKNSEQRQEAWINYLLIFIKK